MILRHKKGFDEERSRTYDYDPDTHTQANYR